MVTQYGMTERLGAIRYGSDQGGEVFMGRDFGHTRDYSEDVAAAIDQEVRAFIDAAHHEAFEILVDNRDVLDALVVELLEKETLDKDEVARIFEPLNRRPARPAWTGSSRRTPSDRGPVESSREIAAAAASANGSANGSSNGSSNGHAGEASPVADPAGTEA
jgi:cell division protease FtsH